MPIYTYRCSSCSTQRDVRHSMTAESPAVCPEPDCGGPLRKVIVAPAIAFKGSGFYRTDHVPAPPKKAAKKPVK